MTSKKIIKPNNRDLIDRTKLSSIEQITLLFNWGEISRMLSGTRAVVLKNKYPKKHEPFIKDLIEAVDGVLIKYGLKN